MKLFVPYGAVLLLCLVAIGSGCQSTQMAAQQTLERQVAQRRALRERSEALVRKGLKAYDTSDAGDAAEYFTKAIEVDARNVNAWMALGVVHFEHDQFYEAAQAFHQASRLAPTRYEPRYNLGSVYEAVGLYARAIGEYEAALDLAPHQLEVMENLARSYIRVEEETPRARDLIQRALKLEMRPHWRAWLEKQLRMMDAADATDEPDDPGSEQDA